MLYQVKISSDAEQDIDEAVIWYQLQQAGLGKEFYEEISEGILRIQQSPLSFPVSYRFLRKFIVSRFPFSIYFQVYKRKKEIRVIRILHQKMNRKNKLLKK